MIHFNDNSDIEIYWSFDLRYPSQIDSENLKIQKIMTINSFFQNDNIYLGIYSKNTINKEFIIGIGKES
jgi:hypothetical protein